MLSDAARRHTDAPARRGATLVELVVTLTLLAAVVATIARSRATSRDAATSALARGELRRQLRAGTAAVQATLRALAPGAGDLLAVADSALELRVTLGASVLCGATPPATDGGPPGAVVLGPGDGRAGAAWHDEPAAGDRLLVLVAEPDPGGPVDSTAAPAWRWHALDVVGQPASTRAFCLGVPDASVLRVPVRAPVPGEAVAGAPLRLLRRARWSVYRSGGRHYLGWRDASADGGLDVVQPVSGPHDRRDADGARRAALSFAYRDSAGALTTDAARVTLVEVRAAGAGAGEPSDSVALAIAARNARP